MPEGRIKLNPLGPHFYVDNRSTDAEVPSGVNDVLTDATHNALDDKLGSLNNVAWVLHVKPHTEMGTVRWDADARRPSRTMEVEIDDKSSRWYSSDAFDYPY